MKKILILGAVFPEPNSTAAGSKMMQWLSFFNQQEHQIIYASTSPQTAFSEPIDKLVSKCVVVKTNDTSFDEFIQDFQPDLVLYDRFMIEEQFSWRIREYAPNCVHILETQDLHFLRYSREKQLSEYNPTTKRELAAILRCDLTAIISDFEMQFLREKFPFVTDKIFYFPLCYTVDKNWHFGINQRKDFCFIGNFLHEPNRQSVLFLKQIWKDIRNQLPEVNLHIYGAYPNQQIMQLHNEKEGFLVHGRAQNVRDVMLHSKVLLAPIQFGAGLKGKLLESMRFGLPSVTTPIGAEGISDTAYWNGKIVTLDHFVNAAIQVYQAEDSYISYQKNGVSILENQFDIHKFQSQITDLITTCSSDVNQWRNQHFLSEILTHHRQQSVRYLSKWIQEKNK